MPCVFLVDTWQIYLFLQTIKYALIFLADTWHNHLFLTTIKYALNFLADMRRIYKFPQTLSMSCIFMVRYTTYLIIFPKIKYALYLPGRCSTDLLT